MAIGESTESMIKKVAFGLVGTLSTLMVKYIAKVGENLQDLKVQNAQIHQMVSSHERQLNSIDNLSQTVYRIESVQKVNSNRLDAIEKKEDRYDRRK